ncbi:MAG: PEP-CTERM system histidine kinase PrsK [Pseudomonadales bacterium]|jgi:putative PEP-CTERM system histidine kinase
MTGFGFASYAIAAVLYVLLGVLLCTSWRGRLQGGLLLLAVLVSVAWAVLAAMASEAMLISLKHLLAVEVIRNVAWTAFLWGLLSYTRPEGSSVRLRVAVSLYLVFCGLTLCAELSPVVNGLVNALLAFDFRILSHVIQAVIGLFLVEQVFRRTRQESRWAVKFLCIGLGGLFVYDFVMFAESLLFSRIDADFWDARGIVNAIIVPFIAVSAARNPQWSIDIFVSRSFVFHTTALLATGGYLLVMAVVGFYLRDFGGSWGRQGQVIFVSSALLVLLLLMFSGRMRAHIKVFFNQHFFSYKYDYRKEWLDLNRALVNAETTESLRDGTIKALSDIADSSGGALWIKREDGSYGLAHERNTHIIGMDRVTVDDSLVAFLIERQWVVEVPEYERTPELYGDLQLSHWCEKVDGLWLVVPLVQQNQLFGFMALVKPRVMRGINWEDHDLLKTVGQQLANYLALMDASEALAHARQFEAYNRLSAFVVHDLKNLVAQLSLVVTNAEKHRHNPEFIDDAIETMANSVEKMNRLLTQLRKGEISSVNEKKISLAEVLQSVAEQQKNRSPVPEVSCQDDPQLLVNRDKLVAVLGHLVQNAQDACRDDGWVKINLYKTDNQAIIEVEDNGSGMDSRFIRERLFKPFDTTKGNAGMGIGVFEARQFVEQQGGRIEVQSQPGQGTRFTLKLPLDKNASREEVNLERSLA